MIETSELRSPVHSDERVALAEEKPHLTIRPSKGWQALDFKQVWLYRDLLMTLANRDVKLRYRQTALGATWVILQPLLSAGVLSFIFGSVAKLSSDGVPYFLFSYIGLLAWNIFNGTQGRAGGALVGNAHLISKVYFPRLILPLSTIFSTLIDFSVAMAMGAVLMALNGFGFTWGLLLLPVWIVLLLMLAIGIGLVNSAFTVKFRDVGSIVGVVMQFLFYACPAVYAISEVPERFRSIYFLNPLASLIEAFRWSLLGTGQLQWGYLTYAAILSVAAFVGGALIFKKTERGFSDVI